MNYQLIRDIVNLAEEFDNKKLQYYSDDLAGFKKWIYDNEKNKEHLHKEPIWEGKQNGRSSESIINTLIVHMNRYAKTYSKSAIHNSEFSTQEDFIYLINLKASGPMSKMDLIRKNVQEKPVGMQIINRLIKKGWVCQSESVQDKRSKVISITEKGVEVLENSMKKIRQATEIVTGNLNQTEKLQLIMLLQKLESFHQPIFSKSLDPSQLVDIAYDEYLKSKNLKKHH